MKVYIVGQKWFGAAVCSLCRARGYEVTGVCAPDGEARPDRLAAVAREAGIRVDRDLAGAAVPAVDLIVAAHAHAWIAPAVRGRARLGALAYHPSLLPLHRGRDAVRWAVKMGERVTGGTVYWMTDKPDAGPIAAQRHVFIPPGESATELWRRRLAPLGLELFERVFADIDAGRIVAEPQDEALATWEPALDRPPLAAL